MLSSLNPIDSAWFFLKQDEGMNGLMDFLPEEDQMAIQRYGQTLSPDQRKFLELTTEHLEQLPPMIQSQLRASAYRVLQQQEGRISDMLPQQNASEDFVEKALFLPVLAAVMMLDAVNVSQGAKASLVGNVMQDIINTAVEEVTDKPNALGKIDYGDVFEYDNEISLVDPVLGLEHRTIEDPSIFQRFTTGIGYGVASGIASLASIPAMLGLGGRAISRGLTGVTSATRNTAGRAVSRLGAKQTARRQSGAAARAIRDRPLDAQGVPTISAEEAAKQGMRQAKPGFIDRTGRAMQRDAAEARAASQKALNESAEISRLTGLKGMGAYPYRGFQAFSRMPRVQEFTERMVDADPDIAAGLAGAALTQIPHSDVDAGGFGGFGAGGFGAGNVGGQASSFGQGQGMQDLANVSSNLSARREIFNPHADYSTTRGQQLAARGTGQEGQFAGLGTKKGDNMKIGEQLLKEVNERIHKAHCGTELKADVCPKCKKENCVCEDKKKADKKPAHGMVIVIGSKAGPGPSSNGKRDKLDSEKKKD
jgi:hypothetical protein